MTPGTLGELQRLVPALLPEREPHAGRLPAHPELEGYSGGANPFGEEVGSAFSALLECGQQLR
jgi:hypothetical protein